MGRRPQRYSGHGETELVIVVDCADLSRAAGFWCAVLGYVAGEPHGPYLSLVPEDGSGVELLLQRVTGAKQQKNRLHLDLRTSRLEAELQRLTGLGAELLTAEPVNEGGFTWHVLADPDGNEFCVLRPPQAHWATFA